MKVEKIGFIHCCRVKLELLNEVGEEMKKHEEQRRTEKEENGAEEKDQTDTILN